MQSIETQKATQQVAEREADTERLISVPSLSFALIITVVAIVVMTILSEVSPGFKDSLKDLAGHHWVAKGLIAFGIFTVAWLVSAVPLARQQDDDIAVRRWVLAAAGSSLAGIVIIFMYFVGHYAAD